MIEKGQKKFIWRDTLLKVFLPLAIVFIFIDQFFFLKGELTSEVIMTYMFKLVLVFMIGFLEGKFEWQMYQKIFGPSLNTLRNLRRKYIMIKGVLVFGLPIGVITFNG